jgi:hypothetical protein
MSGVSRDIRGPLQMFDYGYKEKRGTASRFPSPRASGQRAVHRGHQLTSGGNLGNHHKRELK